MDDIERKRHAADVKMQFQAIALEDLVFHMVAEFRQLVVEEPEIAIGHHGVTLDVVEHDRLAVTRLLAHHHGNIDTAAVIALDQIFLPIAIADHAVEIAIFEGLERRHVVHFLQADDVGIGVCDRERGHLPGVVGRGDHPRRLQLLIDFLVTDIEELQHAILAQLVAKTGVIETGQKVFDIEGSEAQGHEAFQFIKNMSRLTKPASAGFGCYGRFELAHQIRAGENRSVFRLLAFLQA